MPKDMPDKISDRISEDTIDRMSENIPAKYQKIRQIEYQIGCQKICQMPDRISEDMTDRMSEDITNRMSEDMTDKQKI